MMQDLIAVYPIGSVTRNPRTGEVTPTTDPALKLSKIGPTDHIETGQHNGLASTEAKRILGRHDLRRVCTISNEGAVDVYIGGQNVTITNGYRIGVGKAITLETGGEVYGITPSGTGVVHYLAEIDKG